MKDNSTECIREACPYWEATERECVRVLVDTRGAGEAVGIILEGQEPSEVSDYMDRHWEMLRDKNAQRYLQCSRVRLQGWLDTYKMMRKALSDKREGTSDV